MLDFGLAKLTCQKGVWRAFRRSNAAGTDSVLGTEEGAILGTVAYMSPEQAEGKPVDGRSDIFSFGALLYEMLTRRRAFQADSSLAILTAILREDPKPASSVARGIPLELDRIVERCLRKDPERRFQSAARSESGPQGDRAGRTSARETCCESGLASGPLALGRRYPWCL